MLARLALALPLLATPLAAQSAETDLDISYGTRDGQRRIAGMASRLWPVLGGMVHIGGGARVTVYDGDPITFSRVDGDPGGPTNDVAFAPKVLGATVQATAEVELLRGVRIGGNLDLAGYASGGDVATPVGTASVAGASLFRNGSGDRGSLNSEAYLALRLSPNLALRGGVSHYVVGYDLTSIEGTSRYQRFFDVTFVAVRYRF